MKSKKSKRENSNSCLLPVLKYISILVFIVTCVASLFIIITWSLIENEHERNCELYLSQPIPEEVETFLCENQLIPPALDVCNTQNEGISRADISIIWHENIQIGADTLSDVNNKFGQFVTYCSSTTQRNSQYRCTYDLTASGPNVHVFINNTNGTVSDVSVSGCGGS